MTQPAFHTHESERGHHLADYWPLAVLILVTLLAALALTRGTGGGFMEGMHYFMGLFFTVFALLKLFHPAQFMNGFAMVDLLAKRISAYGYLYPLLELALGLAYLGFLAPPATYLATIALMLFGALGVFLALRRGLDLACPCMGTILQVPLSTVTLTENLAMAAMAGWMLIF